MQPVQAPAHESGPPTPRIVDTTRAATGVPLGSPRMTRLSVVTDGAQPPLVFVH